MLGASGSAASHAAASARSRSAKTRTGQGMRKRARRVASRIHVTSLTTAHASNRCNARVPSRRSSHSAPGVRPL